MEVAGEADFTENLRYSMFISPPLSPQNLHNPLLEELEPRE